MPRFTGRNVSFLRVSASTIVPMVLYLDQRHIRWMNSHPDLFDRVVHQVLRPHIQVAEHPECKVLYYFQTPSSRPAVLLKVRTMRLTWTRTLEFPQPNGVTAVPLDTSKEHGANAAVPLRTAAGPVVPPSQDEPVSSPNPALDSDDEASALQKPHVCATYANFHVFGHELVLVIEPTDETLEAHPDWFYVDDDDASQTERRQLASAASLSFDAASPRATYGRHARRGDTPLFRGASSEDEE
ncbi:hypothetical protein MNAN1_001913 [Malassezia nana]|uniref:Uncharacterized protein n=1 Tax=Malassezia nana TaxID=180528 RepID=A0AAF0ELU8_9BASI|nr:hypothetical protein MNAN1_001913 [Malassezia nana]